MEKEKISLVIPCFNSERFIAELVHTSVSVIEEDGRYEYEMVLVNDGSKDRTWDIIKRLAEQNHRIIAVNLSKNFGQHNALMAAYRCVTGDIIVGIDDDGECDPVDMFYLVDELVEKKFDYVCAAYQGRKKHSVFRNLGTAVNDRMAQILIGKPEEFQFSSYYAVQRFVVDQIVTCQNPYPYVAGLVLQSAGRLGTVELKKHERRFGHSGYNLKKLLQLWLNGFTAFSVKPLRIATIIGMIVAFSGFLYGCFTVVKKFMYPEEIVPGYSSVIVVLLLIGGILMVILGLIGEYVGRIYININGLPQYVIREKADYRDMEVWEIERKKGFQVDHGGK